MISLAIADGTLSVSIFAELTAFVWYIFLRFANLGCYRRAAVDG